MTNKHNISRDEIAEAMFWLLTGAPDNLTGQILHLDGGMKHVRN